MIQIIIIEDEPSAMKYLKSIIEKKCNGFEVVATAENGVEGLKKIRTLKPDIVITDIKMPGMNGIEVASIIKDEFPFIYSIIVSGYQDFEYAKGAIKSDVVDYLLKPVNIATLKNLLESLKKKIDADYYDKRIQLLRKMLNGHGIEPWEKDKYLSYKAYRAAVLRRNGLPSRFISRQAVPQYNSIYQEYPSTVPLIKDTNIWIMTGRDEREFILFCPDEIVTKGDFEKYILNIVERFNPDYYTVAISHVFVIEKCSDVLCRLYNIINNKTTIGYSQLIYDNEEDQAGFKCPDYMDSNIENRINYFITNALHEELKGELIKLFNKWNEDKPVQLYMENSLRQIFNQINRHNPTIIEDDMVSIEILLDEILCTARSLDEVLNNILLLMGKMLKCEYKEDQKIDTPVFFQTIEKYLMDNINEPHSLQSLCRRFGVSQSYLSKLFRKYTNMSFSEYISKLRVDMAKHIIENNPNILLKDVALMVGYKDQFYFSRVFRSITGIPPSEYKPEANITSKSIV